MDWVTGLGGLAIVVLIWMWWLDSASRIRRIEGKLNRLMRHLNIDQHQGVPLSDRVKEIACDPARKIEAIKAYREETGAGLKEAKDAIEAYTHGT